MAESRMTMATITPTLTRAERRRQITNRIPNVTVTPAAKEASTTAATKTKKNAKKTERRIPYVEIAALVRQNKTMEEIAKATGRFNEKSDDPTHSIRAIISLMRSRGFRNENGRLVKLTAPKRGQQP